MIKALVEQYVDDQKGHFAIEKSADNFKDYAKSYFSGTVASGLSYLAMIRDGYVWSDHFENSAGRKSECHTITGFRIRPTGSRRCSTCRIKGTRSASSGTFNTTVNDGYINQVEPHLGFAIGT